MDDLMMPPPPEAMGDTMGGGMLPPPPAADGGMMPSPDGPPMPDPSSMALAAVEVTMEMLPQMPDQALSALGNSVMAEMDRRAGAAGAGPEMPAGGGGMPAGAAAMPPAPAPAGGIGALVG